MAAATSGVHDLFPEYDVPGSGCEAQFSDCSHFDDCALCFQDIPPIAMDPFLFQSCSNLIVGIDDHITNIPGCERGTTAVQNIEKCLASYIFQIIYHGLTPSDMCGTLRPVNIDNNTAAPSPAPAPTAPAPATASAPTETSSPTAAPTVTLPRFM